MLIWAFYSLVIISKIKNLHIESMFYYRSVWLRASDWSQCSSPMFSCLQKLLCRFV